MASNSVFIVGLLLLQIGVQGSQIKTEELSKQDQKPILIQLKDLPKPYASHSAHKEAHVIPIPKDPILYAPSGFKVNVFAENLESPRWLALTPSGDVLVTETYNNTIRLLLDANKDGVADSSKVFASGANGLDIPFGMEFVKRSQDNSYWFYSGNTGFIQRFPYQSGDQSLNGTGERILDLPGAKLGLDQHWTRNVLSNGSHLFVSMGSSENIVVEGPPWRAAITVANLDGSENRTWGYGLRNPNGLEFHPITGSLYTTVNERDELGNDLVPDYFTRVEDGEFFGWPYAYLSPDFVDPRMLDPHTNESLRPDLVNKTHTPDVLFQAHSAAIGLKFYTGSTFPKKYQNGAFVAFRGSWNRNQGTGYKIVFVPFDPKTNRPTGSYENFVLGFLTNPSGPDTWGRPVGLLTMPDGSLLFTEEGNNRIYRVQYTPSGSGSIVLSFGLFLLSLLTRVL